MKVLKNPPGYILVNPDDKLNETGYFPTIEALENHIKLMLIAVHNYKENTVAE